MTSTLRFSTAPWYGTFKDITIIGLGGVGNGLARILALNGHRLSIYDYDDVEEHNCIPQGYPRKYIGVSKYAACKSIIASFVENFSVDCHGKWDDSEYLRPIVIACPDNFDTRISAFQKWKRDSDRELFISVGLTGDDYKIIVIKRGDEDLFDMPSDSVSDEPVVCTNRQSLYMAQAVQAKVAEIINKFIIDPDLVENTYVHNGITG